MECFSSSGDESTLSVLLPAARAPRSRRPRSLSHTDDDSLRSGESLMKKILGLSSSPTTGGSATPLAAAARSAASGEARALRSGPLSSFIGLWLFGARPLTRRMAASHQGVGAGRGGGVTSSRPPGAASRAALTADRRRAMPSDPSPSLAQTRSPGRFSALRSPHRLLPERRRSQQHRHRSRPLTARHSARVAPWQPTLSTLARRPRRSDWPSAATRVNLGQRASKSAGRAISVLERSRRPALRPACSDRAPLGASKTRLSSAAQNSHTSDCPFGMRVIKNVPRRVAKSPLYLHPNANYARRVSARRTSAPHNDTPTS